MKYEIGTKSDSYIFAIEKNPIPITLGPNRENETFFNPNDDKELYIPTRKRHIRADEIEAYRLNWKRIRWFCYSLFWFGWLLSLVIAILLAASHPKCLLSIREWWKDSIIYEIWTLSYPNSNEDESAKLEGIRRNLDELRRNGVEAIYMRPVIKVEKTAIGVIGHTELNSQIGAFDDLKKLIKEAHSKGLRVLIDFPLAVTSVAHPWFDLSALASRPENYPFAGFYYWRRNIPKSDYISAYKDSTLRYFHVKSRPDLPVLSWANRNVSQSIMNALSFWIKLGIDGFHLSSIDYLQRTPDGKHPDWAEISKILHSISAHITRTAEQGKIFLFTSHEHLSEFTKRMLIQDGHIDAILHTELRKLAIGNRICSKLDASICECVNEIVADLLMFHQNQGRAVWPIWTYGDAFTARLASRMSSRTIAELLLMMELMLPGTPLIYYGEEIGKLNCRECKSPRGPLECIEENIQPDNVTSTLSDFSIVDASDDLRRNFRRIVRLRQHSKTLQSGQTYITKPVERHSFALCRYLGEEHEDGMHTYGDVVIFAANFGTDSEVKLSLLDLPPLQKRGSYKKGKIVARGINSKNFRLNSMIDLSRREITLGPIQGVLIHASSGYY